ncbi:MAG: hypothetical protein Q4D19_04465 [Lautropia sp.]|nr:hypothetical protein [Lautropia sp.]
MDRFTGKVLGSLPAAALPGRLALIDSAVLNEHTELREDDLLLDDGSGVVSFLRQRCELSREVMDVEMQEERDLLAEAIASIASKVADSDCEQASPMLPLESAVHFERGEAERVLEEVLAGGHLHAISCRPRMDLRYEDMISPVSRARRLAPTALNHLASHSHCWQQRTLGGVLPRKVLARFSEDDYSIYENRLFVRLIDRAERHLVRRIARVRGVSSHLEDALSFQNSENTHYLLRERICALWGESYEDDYTGVQLESGRKALRELESLLRAVRGLKQGGLYSRVPGNALVPSSLHRTNVLVHDPHYRHLPKIWEELNNAARDDRLKPEERYARQRDLHVAYGRYVGLVLRRSLERYGLSPCKEGGWAFERFGRRFLLSCDGLDWLVRGPDGEDLRLVPVAWFGESVVADEDIPEDRIICWPGRSGEENAAKFLRISPMDLYVVERMGQVLDSWMVRKLLSSYGAEIGPLPASIKNLADGWGRAYEQRRTNFGRLVAPLTPDQQREVLGVLEKVANSDVRKVVQTVIERTSALASLCGHRARFSPSADLGFSCKCDTCGASWSLRKNRESVSSSVFQMRLKDAPAGEAGGGFEWSGRDWLEFEVPQNA